jgi:hypothetical protein
VKEAFLAAKQYIYHALQNKCHEPLTGSWLDTVTAVRSRFSRVSLLLLTRRPKLKKSLSQPSVALPGANRSRRSPCATDRNEGSLVEPIPYSLQAVLRAAWILASSLSVFACSVGAGESQPFGRLKDRLSLRTPSFDTQMFSACDYDHNQA